MGWSENLGQIFCDFCGSRVDLRLESYIQIERKKRYKREYEILHFCDEECERKYFQRKGGK